MRPGGHNMKDHFRTIAVAIFTAVLFSACGSSSGNTPTPSNALFTKHPYLMYSGDNTKMTVLWQADSTPTTATIEWGSTTSYADGSATVTETSSVADGHQFTYSIGARTPASRTYYRVTVDQQTATGSFLTAPRDSATSLTFYAYCDTRTNIDQHDAVAKQILADIAAAPDSRQTFIVLCGDLVNYGLNEDNWTSQFFDPAYTNLATLLSEVPIMGTLGNHEYYVYPVDTEYENAHMGELFRKYWPQPLYETTSHFFYSFDYGPLHVVALDQYTTNLTDSGAQYSWLDDDLQTTTKTWKAVAFHVPAYSSNLADEDSTRSKNMRDYYQPLFEDYDVDIAIQGHHHYYSRSVVNSIQYILLGTGGAPFESYDTGVPYVVAGPTQKYHFGKFEIVGNTMTVTVIDKDGNTIDSFTL